MKQVLQSLKDGSLNVAEVPAAGAEVGRLLLRSKASLVSAGTERMLLDFGQASWIGKARQQPDKVRQVLEKIRTDGLVATLETVQAKLDQPLALGYSNAGLVLEIGKGITEFAPGDRVVSNGPHAETTAVPKNLCARIPDSVSDDSATFTVLGAIGLEGVRLVQPTLGESVVVMGLGLIGLLTVQILRAQGCRVLGIDFDPRKLVLAEAFGAETLNLSGGGDPVMAAERFSRGQGVDAVLITAATKSNEPVHQAALMCRKRGRIVLVGVAGLELSRDDFYKKELTFQVSCSYGPGRYDTAYEGGQDYPRPYVRWTAQRNFEAVLDMMADGRLQVQPLITHRFPIERALDAYALLEGDEFYLGILLQYSHEKTETELRQRRVVLQKETGAANKASQARIGFVGSGGYATKILMPAFQSAGAQLVAVASTGGLSAMYAAKKFEFAEATTDVAALLADDRIDTVVIATRHDSHASLVCRALQAGKHVFVEKPLALKAEEIEEVEAAYGSLSEPRLVMVGFNRRFAPQVTRMRQLLAAVKGLKTLVYTVNAGAIPGDHWTQDPAVGGGRILGEACHFLDLLRYLTGCPATQIQVTRQSADNVSIGVTYEDGSIGTVHYVSGGHKSFSKERLEVFGGGRVLVLNNYRKLRGYGWPGFRRMNLWSQNKGAREMAVAFVHAVRNGGPAPIPFEELIEVARLTVKAAAL